MMFWVDPMSTFDEETTALKDSVTYPMDNIVKYLVV